MQILSTKLSIPSLRSRAVARPRLIQKLNLGLDCGFLLISAPAGYGKSTMLTAWLDQMDFASTWLSIDDGDNQPARFLTYLTAALRKIDGSVGEDLEGSLRASPLPDAAALLTTLVNELAQVARPFCLVLDDYHLIQNQTVHQLVGFLLEHRPAPLHLAISTRADPPLPLARLRARAEMMELRQPDLCFSEQEAAEFLYHTMGLRISSEDVRRITARTEGWIAGLQMAAISMQGSEDISGFITALTGSHHYIFDYLLEEILARQSAEIRRFLLDTSILDQLTAALCDALVIDEAESLPRRPSAAILEELDHANLFLIPLDNERRWYRYHHLFSDLLRMILEKTYPGISSELHRRACSWYEIQGMLSEALQHALAAGDTQLVAQIISANVMMLTEHDEVIPALQKIDSLALDQLIASPWLGIARAWIVQPGDMQKSRQILDGIEKSLENTAEGAELRSLRGHIWAVRANLLAAYGDWEPAVAHAQQAIELLPANEVVVRARCLTTWGKALGNAQNFTAALPIMEQALELSLQADKPHAILNAAAALATIYLFMGRMKDLQRVCLEAMEVAEAFQQRYQRELTATAEVYSLLARVHGEWGENENAVEYARKGLALSERWGHEVYIVECLLYLGRALVFSNDLKQARKMFQRAEKITRKVSAWMWQQAARFILESLMDSEPSYTSEIASLARQYQESGAELPTFLKARLALRQGKPGQALDTLEQALVELNGAPAYNTVRIYALRALAYQAQGDEKSALAQLQIALELGEPENRVVSFVREGPGMEKLLRLAKGESIAPEFVHRTLAAFEDRRKLKPGTPITAQKLVEPLSARELQVLQLLAQGCADKQIAESLVISRETVHKHLKNIYGKLDVHSRTEAIARGRELNLL